VTELRTGSSFAGFRIEGLLGRGGMGNVYLASESRLDRQVALKVIRSELADNETFRRRFASESRAAASIEHPGVVGVYRAGEHRGRLYLAMQYVRGVDLQARLAREGRLPPERAASLVAQLAEALDAIHASGLVHRDVKPANVIVAGRDGREHAYLTDFGLAKAAASASRVTRTGEVIGSLDYLAPEQIEGRRVDARTDVYALGCVLFELVTGDVPFPGRENSSKLWAHVNEPPSAASSRGGAHLAGLDPILRRAMAKDPAERFPSTGDFGRAAMAAIRGEAVAKREREAGARDAAPAPETLPLPTETLPGATKVLPRKRGRRRRIAALTVVLVVIGLGVGAAIEVPELTDGGGEGTQGIELPDLSGERLNIAEQELSRLGLRSRPEGGGLFGIVVPENWEVCETNPAGGDETRPGATVQLAVDRPGAC
jgi:serine/threonine protein kinase